MKKIIILFIIAGSLSGFGQTSTVSLKNVIQNMGASDIPATLLTDANSYWTISTVSSTGYVNTTPGSNDNSYKSGSGMIVKFRFMPGNRFEYLLYVQGNSFGTNTETWTEVNGTVVFSKDANGQPVFTTSAEKGTYRIIRNGAITTRVIPVIELNTQHSNTYLWEKAFFGDDPSNEYLLMLDLDAHPGANINDPSTINPSWVSKFQIPNK